MQPHISKTYLLLDIAEKIWNVAALTYFLVGNNAQIFEICNKVHGTKQGELTISQYFAELSELWQESNYYQDFQANCAKDVEEFQKMVEKERVFDFLVELNTEYDQIRVHVLVKTLFPSFHMSYFYVQQEESRGGVMLYNPPLKNAGLIANQDGPSGGKSTKDHLTCDYCGKPRHTKDSCWKLHGRPTRGRGGKRGGNSRPQANLLDSVTIENKSTYAGSFTSDEIEHLRRFLSQLDFTSIVKSNHTNLGPPDKENDWQW